MKLRWALLLLLAFYGLATGLSFLMIDLGKHYGQARVLADFADGMLWFAAGGIAAVAITGLVALRDRRKTRRRRS